MKQIIIIVGLISCLWVSATSAQEPILDTDGNPLRRGRTAEYYVKPAASESGGAFTLLGRTDKACPLFVGQRNVTSDDVRPVRFSPHDAAENTVLLGRSSRVEFSGEAPCGGSTTWKVGDFNPPNRRPIMIGGSDDGFTSYFRISKFQNFDNMYVIEWCPAELCPFCRFACGSVGLQIVGGRRFFALDGNGTGFPFTDAFPVVFERVYYTRPNDDKDVKITMN